MGRPLRKVIIVITMLDVYAKREITEQDSHIPPFDYSMLNILQLL